MHRIKFLPLAKFKLYNFVGMSYQGLKSFFAVYLKRDQKSFE